MSDKIVDLHEDEGPKMSGGEVPHGTNRVWAMQIFRGEKVHFWHLRATGYRRLCDGALAPAFLTNGQSTLWYGGNFPKCKRCMRKLTKGDAS
ncbi:hypothetical protein [Henriciella aquimarina]|uniref:hypothetical protein n=1 Tax=Henriciella aquimarina TaxID=545261 RepID=UPI0009FF7732|nr:hypothetical protein [Henriciella aquimarina]